MKNTEYDRPFTRSDMGLTIITRHNLKRTPERSAENAKVALNLLLLITVTLGWATMFSMSFLPWSATSAIFYALCYLITNKGQ